ncbi:MAG: hypothetical protein LBT04_04235 [Prevotellaceae bacterium]|jgi:uncharacterized protein (TIGR02145 family)|nr:hypothetical protein [Prevotellaceae bacterium]
MRKEIFTFAVALTATIAGLNAQVTIGLDKAPETFSVLELISNNNNGLRLPQLSTVERDAVRASQPFIDKEHAEATGLTIFNTTKNCVEYWNSSEWVGIGCPPPTPKPAVASTQGVCPTGSTVANLEPNGADIKWYATATGGTVLPATTPLVNGKTYYASQTVNSMESTERAEVTVTFLSSCAALSANAYKIFSPVSVMYTYQYQDLEAYKSATTGGEASSFQWKVNRKRQPGTVVDIPAVNGGMAKIFRVPVHFPETAQTWNSAALKTLLGSVNKNDTLIFTCQYKNPNTATPQTVSTEIEFIKLDETKFITSNGVKYYYVDIDAAPSYTGKGSGTAGKLRILATNLGVENENAADLGDFYQWGRIADGHQTTGWGSSETTISGTITKIVALDAATIANQIEKTTGTAITYDGNSATLATELGGTGIPFLQVTDADHKGKFVYGDNTWRDANLTDQHIWATANPNFYKTANDPCPTGWHVPTDIEWNAISESGTNYNSGGVYATTYNTWRLPSTSTSIVGTDSHAGGLVITAKTDNSKSVILPASGLHYDDFLTDTGAYGYYWASTSSSANEAQNLRINQSYFFTNHHPKALGNQVRCVSEVNP